MPQMAPMQISIINPSIVLSDSEACKTGATQAAAANTGRRPVCEWMPSLTSREITSRAKSCRQRIHHLVARRPAA